MRFIVLISFMVVLITRIEANQRITFPLIYRWSKRIKESKLNLIIF